MKKSFDQTEFLVMHLLQPQHAEPLLGNSTVATTILQGWILKTKTWSDYIKRRLRYIDTQPTKGKTMAHIVAGYQSQIIIFLNTVLAYKYNTTNAFLLNLYDRVIKELENLVLFIHLEYPGYFDESAKIPTIDLLRYWPQLRARVRIIKQNFSPLITDNKLLQLMMTPLCQFAGYSQKINPTYNELSYMKDLVKKLVPIHFKSESDAIDTNLIEFLISNNFNSFAFIDYCTKGFSSTSAALESDNQKVAWLSFQLKKLLQLQTIPVQSLRYNSLSVKEVLVNWLREEISFLNKQRPATTDLSHPVYPSVVPAGIVKEEKIKTNFSAAEIALLMRCLQETKLIQFRDRRNFIKNISQQFTSIGTGGKGISWTSLDSKYSAVEQNTIKSLRKKIRSISDYSYVIEKGLI